MGRIHGFYFTSHPLTDKSSVALLALLCFLALIKSSLSRSSSLLLHSSWANCELSYVRLETRTTTEFLSDEPAGAFPSSPDVAGPGLTDVVDKWLGKSRFFKMEGLYLAILNKNNSKISKM